MGLAASWAIAKDRAESSGANAFDREHPTFHPFEDRDVGPVAIATGQADSVIVIAELFRRWAYARVSPPALFSRSVDFFAFAFKPTLPDVVHPDTPHVFDDNGDGFAEDVWTQFDSAASSTTATLRSAKQGQAAAGVYPTWPAIMPLPDGTYGTTYCARGYQITAAKAIVDYSAGFEFID